VPLAPALNSWLSGTDITGLAEEILPSIMDRSWRLEHTVDAVSTAFEHYLSWVVGSSSSTRTHSWTRGTRAFSCVRKSPR
jgi:hypothetical protein